MTIWRVTNFLSKGEQPLACFVMLALDCTIALAHSVALPRFGSPVGPSADVAQKHTIACPAYLIRNPARNLDVSLVPPLTPGAAPRFGLIRMHVNDEEYDASRD